MATYRVFGFPVASDLVLPELAPCDGPAALTIRRGCIDPSPSPPFDIWPHADGRSWVQARPTARGYQVRHGELASFDIDRRGRSIVYHAHDPVEYEDAPLRHVLIDHVLPLMLSLDNLVLHASSVATPSGTVAFAGAGGAGKSTLALALARAGYAMVSDDGLLVRDDEGCVVATPAYPGVRLWRDSAAALGAAGAEWLAGTDSDKTCYREQAAFAHDAPPLHRICVIDPHPSATVTLERMSGAEAVMAIVQHAYRLSLDDGEALARQLDGIMSLARRVPVWRLSFPRALAWLTAVAAAIGSQLESDAEFRA